MVARTPRLRDDDVTVVVHEPRDRVGAGRSGQHEQQPDGERGREDPHPSSAARNQVVPVAAARASPDDRAREAPRAVGVDLECLQPGQVEREQRAGGRERECERACSRIVDQRGREQRGGACEAEQRQRDAGELAVLAVLHRLAAPAADRAGHGAAARALDLEIGGHDQLEQRQQRGQAASAHPALPPAFCTAAAIAS